jgi:zeta-carotene desaturase
MGVPTVPLTDLYNAAGDYIRARGVLHFRRPSNPLTQIHSRECPPEISKRRLRRQPEEVFDYLILALPLMLSTASSPMPPRGPLREDLKPLRTAPITGIHLWFDRQISDLDHAVLLDRTVNGCSTNPVSNPAQSSSIRGTGSISHKTRIASCGVDREAAKRRENAAHGSSWAGQNEEAPEGRKNDGSATNGSYIELVVSSSKSLIDKSRAEIVDLALSEVREFFPAAREADLVKSTVIKELHATYSPRPGIDTYRPAPITKWPRVFLAGDWTATGWPATMEGAVRSGYHAAAVLARAAVRKDPQFVSSDLPPTGLMRLFY